MPLNKGNKIQTVKYSPPPPNLPMLGKVEPSQVVFMGRTNYVAALEEKRFVFGINQNDRKRHVYIVGKSGVGKSKLEEVMIRQDIAYGRGVCVIDPYGELVEEILHFIPKNRVNDVCVFNPEDVGFPISFNPFSKVEPTFRHQFTQSIVEILQKQFGGDWSPRIEHVIRFSVLALLDCEKSNMRGMIRILIDKNYREKIIDNVTDDMVRHFWKEEFEEWSKKFDSEVIIPIVNKLWQFLSNPILVNIFGQKENKIDFEKIMNNKKIILINLAKDKIGDENASFLGALFMTKIKQAGMARAKLNISEKNDFYLYIDEFNNIITDGFENILSESRKYGINLTVAHQYIGQLSQKIEQAVLGNIGTIILFRVGGDDATKLRSEFAPVFDVKDMINLGTGEFYIKMIINGESYDPFSSETLEVLPSPHSSFKEEVLDSSRRFYATTEENANRIMNEDESSQDRPF